MNPDVTVVIVTWNVARLLSDCLESLQHCEAGVTLEVIVVDNASSDDTLELLQARFPWVRVIANRENRGYARANNQGIDVARGRFIMLLNPDTIVSEGALASLVDFLVNNPQAGAAGPKLRHPSGLPDICSARRSYNLAAAFFIDSLHLRPVPLIGPKLFRWLKAPYDYEKTQSVEAVSGAAIIVRRELLQSLGGFGEMFFHGGEDLDLCFRIRKSGWEIWHLATALIVHLGAESSKKAPVRVYVDNALSTELFFSRCHGKWPARGFRWIVKTFQIPAMVTIGILKFLCRRETAGDLSQRLQIARRLMIWKRVP
jgi:GT2 family glycosyltransferase